MDALINLDDEMAVIHRYRLYKQQGVSDRGKRRRLGEIMENQLKEVSLMKHMYSNWKLTIVVVDTIPEG